MTDVRILWVMGHVEVLDSRGRFLFSADTEAEAMEDLEELGLSA